MIFGEASKELITCYYGITNYSAHIHARHLTYVDREEGGRELACLVKDSQEVRRFLLLEMENVPDNKIHLA